MKVAEIKGERNRIMVLFAFDDNQPPFIKYNGKKYTKLHPTPLRGPEKEIWEECFIYEAKNI